jgi:hypothetical protein
MTIIVVDSSYLSTRGRKPSMPAFLYQFHQASGVSVPDQFGNGPAMELTSGTEGTIWASRGRWSPPNNNTLVSGHFKPNASDPLRNYPHTVLDPLTAGGAFIGFAWLYRTGFTTNYEAIMSLGRDGASYGGISFRQNAGGGAGMWVRGVGANNGVNFAGDQPPNGSESLLLWHATVTSDGITVNGWVDGVVQSEWVGSWTSAGNAKPGSMSLWDSDGAGFAIGALGASNTLTSYDSRLNKNTAGSAIHTVGAVRLAAPNVGLALDLVNELRAYKRHVGPILAGI